MTWVLFFFLLQHERHQQIQEENKLPLEGIPGTNFTKQCLLEREWKRMTAQTGKGKGAKNNKSLVVAVEVTSITGSTQTTTRIWTAKENRDHLSLSFLPVDRSCLNDIWETQPQKHFKTKQHQYTVHVTNMKWMSSQAWVTSFNYKLNSWYFLLG